MAETIKNSSKESIHPEILSQQKLPRPDFGGQIDQDNKQQKMLKKPQPKPKAIIGKSREGGTMTGGAGIAGYHGPLWGQRPDSGSGLGPLDSAISPMDTDSFGGQAEKMETSQRLGKTTGQISDQQLEKQTRQTQAIGPGVEEIKEKEDREREMERELRAKQLESRDTKEAQEKTVKGIAAKSTTKGLEGAWWPHVLIFILSIFGDLPDFFSLNVAVVIDQLWDFMVWVFILSSHIFIRFETGFVFKKLFKWFFVPVLEMIPAVGILPFWTCAAVYDIYRESKRRRAAKEDLEKLTRKGPEKFSRQGEGKIEQAGRKVNQLREAYERA